MDTSGLLETVLALTLLYALLSLVASGIQELAAGWLNLRGRLLHKALGEMLASMGSGMPASTLLASPVLRPMARPEKAKQKLENRETTAATIAKSTDAPVTTPGNAERPTVRLSIRQAIAGGAAFLGRVGRRPRAIESGVRPAKAPSYLSADSFVAAVLTTQGTELLRAKMAQMPGAITGALSDEEALAKWYGETMDRVSGRYARKAKTWLFVIGCLLALMLNADTWRLVKTYQREPARRRAAAVLAESFASSQMATLASTRDSAAAQKAMQAAANELSSQMDTSGAIPLGWHAKNRPFAECGENRWCKTGGVARLLVGVLLTGVAISFGAPFWFDLLSKVANARSAGRKPDAGGTSGTQAVTVTVGGDGDRPREFTAVNPPRL
jgi:hypothetical protein